MDTIDFYRTIWKLYSSKSIDQTSYSIYFLMPFGNTKNGKNKMVKLTFNLSTMQNLYKTIISFRHQSIRSYYLVYVCPLDIDLLKVRHKSVCNFGQLCYISFVFDTLCVFAFYIFGWVCVRACLQVWMLNNLQDRPKHHNSSIGLISFGFHFDTEKEYFFSVFHLYFSVLLLWQSPVI